MYKYIAAVGSKRETLDWCIRCPLLSSPNHEAQLIFIITIAPWKLYWKHRNNFTHLVSRLQTSLQNKHIDKH